MTSVGFYTVDGMVCFPTQPSLEIANTLLLLVANNLSLKTRVQF